MGKVVFANASRIRTFFGITLRDGDPSPLLMGEAGLTIHSLQNSSDVLDWYGYYAIHRPQEQHYVPTPIQKTKITGSFSRLFSLDRTAPGLSILVPYLRKEVTLNDLARTAIEQYFLPILSGRLEVIVRESTKEIRISRATIEGAVGQVAWPKKRASTREEITALLALAKWQISLAIGDYVSMAAVGDDGSYSIGSESFCKDDLTRVSEAYTLGQRVAIRVPVRVQLKNSTRMSEEIRLVLERDESLRRSNVPHLRSGINVSKMRENAGSGVRGLLIVGIDSEQQGQLDKLLQASEGPSHVNWETQGEGYDNARSLYEDAHRVIRFVRRLVRDLVELFATPTNAKDTRTLSFFFPDYEQLGTAAGGGAGEPQGQGSGAGKKLPKQPPPTGVIEVFVRSFSSDGLRPVDAASVILSRDSSIIMSAITNASGKYTFGGLAAAEYQIVAEKDVVGRAQKMVVLESEQGIQVELLLRSETSPRMFDKVLLEDGFAIRGVARYAGPLRKVQVRMAYAAWGGKKSFSEADFSLQEGGGLSVEFHGIKEMERKEMIAAPNELIFAPLTNEFCVEVRGFDVNRALFADVRTFDDGSSTENENE